MRTSTTITDSNSGTSKWINNLALTSTRTAIIPTMQLYDVIVLCFAYTRSAGTAVNWTIEVSNDNGVTYFLYPPVKDPSTTPITVTHPSYTKVGTASVNFTDSYVVAGFTHMKITVTCTAAGAGDLLTLTATGQAIT